MIIHLEPNTTYNECERYYQRCYEFLTQDCSCPKTP